MINNKKYKLWQSFDFAFRGIFKAIAKERNLKIHLGAAILAIFLGIILKINLFEWLVIVLVIGSVIAAEIFNSAIEAGADLLKSKLDLGYYETYWIRNFSAGAVLVLAITSLIVGMIIFLPKIF